MDQILTDLRFGCRSLIRSPGLATVGAATAIYSTIYAVLLDPFPYKDVDRLMSIKVWQPEQRGFRT